MTNKKRERFELIETIGYWERVVNASLLKKFLGLGWNITNKELREYNQMHPNTFTYDASTKVFRAREGFKPSYVSTDWEVYHSHLLKYAHLYNESLWGENSVEVINSTLNSVNPDVIEGVSRAIRLNLSCKAKYCSMQHPRGITRRIHPHAIAFNGRRWHLRGFSDAHDDFRDFNLSRIKTITMDSASDIDALTDYDWNDFKTLELEAHPALSIEQKTLILSDYSKKTPFSLTMRAAMIKYFVKHHDIAINKTDSAISYPLYLSNAEVLQKYLLIKK